MVLLMALAVSVSDAHGVQLQDDHEAALTAASCCLLSLLVLLRACSYRMTMRRPLRLLTALCDKRTQHRRVMHSMMFDIQTRTLLDGSL